jgi:hypothetical protein
MTTVILSTSADWDEWLELMKTKAIGEKVWKYLDPSTPKDQLPTLIEPVRPTPADVNPNKTLLSQLDEDEKDELELRREQYRDELAKYNRQETAIANFPSHIQESISRNFLVYTFGAETTHDMLVALRQRVAPTDEARMLELIGKYNKLKKAPRSQDLESWFQQWERTYREATKINLAEVQGKRPVYDFLGAISTIAPEFYMDWMMKTQDTSESSDFYEILEKFRQQQLPLLLGTTQHKSQHGRI